jgi:hypothetical protein
MSVTNSKAPVSDRAYLADVEKEITELREKLKEVE